MCGIFGFIGPRLDRDLLAYVATLAGRRGPHASGWTWWDGDVVRVERFLGSSEANARALPEAATVLIGHSRLATSGGYDDLAAAQPVMAETAIALVHNGIARLKKPGPNCKTACDSEVLARIMMAESGPLSGKLKSAIVALEEDAPFALLTASQCGIAGSRRALPLFVREGRADAYFCSARFDGAEPLDEMEISHWESPNGR